MNISEIKAEEENKTDEIINVNDITIRIDKEKEKTIMNNNLEDNNKFNIFEKDKLIKPILIW